MVGYGGIQFDVVGYAKNGGQEIKKIVEYCGILLDVMEYRGILYRKEVTDDGSVYSKEEIEESNQ